MQAASSKARHNTLHSQKGAAGKRPILSLDKSALDKSRLLSKLLDEAPMQGGCPFMVLTDDTLQPSGRSKTRSCPFSSGRAPDAHARETPVQMAEETVLPLTSDRAPAAETQESSIPDAGDNKVCPFGASAAAVTPAPEVAVPGGLNSSSLSAFHLDGTPQVADPTAEGHLD